MRVRIKLFKLTVLISLFCWATVGFGLPLSHHSSPESLNTIYSALELAYPDYNGITYGLSTNNTLLKDQWVIQTPNIWGTSVKTYNKIFNAHPNFTIDPDFKVPTCHASIDCNPGATCQAAPFTIGSDGLVKSLCLSKADVILSDIYNAMTTAKRSIDITTLQPAKFPQLSFSSGAFTATLKNAIYHLAVTNSKDPAAPVIHIRILQGMYLGVTAKESLIQVQDNIASLQLTQKQFLHHLTNDLPPNNHLMITVGSMNSCYLFNKLLHCGNQDQQKDLWLDFGWNHGKIIDVDNHLLITGGHNLWSEDYLQANPVNDLSMMIAGPVVTGATIYANNLWNFTCNHKGLADRLVTTYNNGVIESQCQPAMPTDSAHTVYASKLSASNPAINYSHVSALYISKLNSNVLAADADQSEYARVIALRNAQQSIKISQQALFTQSLTQSPGDFLHPLITINGTVMDALAAALVKHVQVYIVSSTLGGSDYSSNVNPDYIYHYLQAKLVALGDASLDLSKYLHLAVISYDHQETSDKNHDKMWMVDDHIFYIGSHNFYPSSLQQFGIIIDNAQAGQDLNNKLWKPLWANSLLYHPSIITF